MGSIVRKSRIVVAVMLAFGFASSLHAQDVPSGPETVMATFRIKPGEVDAFLKMMPQYWAALRALDLVIAEPHLLLRGEENGKPIVVEVFRWKSHDAPDSAPPAIRVYWNKMQAMVEDRDGHKGIEFPEMTIVGDKH